MSIENITHYLKRFWTLGPHKSVKILSQRTQTKASTLYLKNKALRKKAHTEWNELCAIFNIKTYQDFFNSRKNKVLLEPERLFAEVRNEQADFCAKDCFNILGSGNVCFLSIAWHEDFRLKQYRPQADCKFNAELFYTDINIQPGEQEELVKDIKVPWELSRFQYLFVLGTIFQKTKKSKYADCFIRHVSDWLDKNPYLLGTNWVCPMDVAIRAINWIWAFYFFKEANITEDFWKRFFCSLYDHMCYLENNWEVYDTITSNHYLSDLLGYLYLCYFFSDLPGIEKKTQWCWQELIKECDKQIFSEGTDYEGSTAYHRLITEIFYHAYIIARYLPIEIPPGFETKLKKMFNFIEWCTISPTQYIQIGDNDSGTIVSGITPAMIITMKLPEAEVAVKHYHDFGISFYKKNPWHISLRHHVYHEHQVTGHFHNDMASINIVTNGIEVFVDPGSYVYTASQLWRNRFRSIAAHNTFFIKDHEPIALDNRLFFLDLKPTVPLNYDKNSMHSQHDAYAALFLKAERKLKIDEKSVIIDDAWIVTDAQKFDATLISCWNFSLAAHIIPKQEQDKLILYYNDKPLLEFKSHVPFVIENTFISPVYGVKVASKRLRAYVPLEQALTNTIMLTLI